MTPADRSQLQAAIHQVAVLKKQAIAIGMMAETLEHAMQAFVTGEPEADGPIPPKQKYFNATQRGVIQGASQPDPG